MCTDRVRRLCIVGIAVVTLGLMQSAFAQSPRSYAVLSLIGDKLEIVTAVAETGSHLDRNHHELMLIGSPVFDNAALGSAEKAITQCEPNAKVTLLRSNEARLFELQERSLEVDTDGNELMKNVLAVARDAQVSHIILVAKYRAEAYLDAKKTHLGHGKLKGLGFYIDRNKKMTRSDTGERGVGFLAPYSHIKVLLIDAQSGAVLRSESVAKGTTLSAARAKDSTHPWDALTARQKVATIERMVTSETNRLVLLVLNESRLTQPGILE